MLQDFLKFGKQTYLDFGIMILQIDRISRFVKQYNYRQKDLTDL